MIGEEVAENISVAEKLLRELRPIAKYLINSSSNDFTSFLWYRDKRRVQILQNYLWLSTKQKRNVDEAMASFIDMLSQDQGLYPRPVWGIRHRLVDTDHQTLASAGRRFEVSGLDTYQVMPDTFPRLAFEAVGPVALGVPQRPAAIPSRQDVLQTACECAAAEQA